MVPLIEKALRTSALKLNPQSERQELVVPVPRCLLPPGHAMCLLMSLTMFMLPTGLAMCLLPTSLVMCQLLKSACSQDLHGLTEGEQDMLPACCNAPMTEG